MEMSEQVDQLFTALAAAQSEITDAKKDKTNPHFKSKYADLPAVADACKGALNRHGLSFVQVFEPASEGQLALTTQLCHSSGQWLRGTLCMPLAKLDPQGFGSAATYARRYGLASLVGVCADDDDDGNAASDRNGQSQERTQFRPPQAPPGQVRREEPVQAPPAESRGDARAAATDRAAPSAELGCLKADCKRLYVTLGGNPDDLKAMRDDFSIALGSPVPNPWPTDLATWLRIRNGLEGQVKAAGMTTGTLSEAPAATPAAEMPGHAR